MKLSLPILLAASTLILAPTYAMAQHIDVGPRGLSVHDGGHGRGHRHVERHRHIERHHHHVDRHDRGHRGHGREERHRY